MKLLSNRILVRKLPVDKTTESGLILSAPSKNKPDVEVVLIGEEVQRLKVGDKVKKYQYSEGIPITYNGEKLLMLKEDEDIELVD